jgi:undecaprenyl diphosphate synthase
MENENNKIPNHVGLILDGNRRWARERHLPDFEGHRRGMEKMRQVPGWFFARGIKVLSVYVFSTENWKRKQEEVNYLMKIFRDTIETEFQAISENDYRVVVSGRIDELPGDLPEAIMKLESSTTGKNKGILNICLNYGGRAEIVDAVKKMIRNSIAEEQVHEGIISKYLYNGNLFCDPDVIVRTSGEKRLSGFMLWRSAYSELVFLKKYWPEFEESDIDFILREYAERQRRFGGN